MGLRPHDLVRLADPDAVAAAPGMPAWVGEALARASFAVVRRCRPASGMVPVGLRGRRRGERFAADVPAAAIAGCVTPEELAWNRTWDSAPRRAVLPALAALAAAAARLDALGLPWGPTGGVGFELATGVPVLTASSDIDLVIRTPDPPSAPEARHLAALLEGLQARFDVQLETAEGALALAEVARGGPCVLLRTGGGPRLVPWPPTTRAAA